MRNINLLSISFGLIVGCNLCPAADTLLFPPLPSTNALSLPKNTLSLPKPSTNTITLAWDYPSNSISDDLSFVITATNQLSESLSNWIVAASVSATNSIMTNSFDGTNFSFKATFMMNPDKMFFTAYASNFWGMSTNSNILKLPPTPIPIYLDVKRP